MRFKITRSFVLDRDAMRTTHDKLAWKLVVKIDAEDYTPTPLWNGTDYPVCPLGRERVERTPRGHVTYVSAPSEDYVNLAEKGLADFCVTYDHHLKYRREL